MTGDQTATTGDSTATTADQTATTGDQIATTGDSTATTADQTATTGDDTALIGDTTGRARARDLGLAPGTLPPGPVNAITDVPGVRVGHTTLIKGSSIRTGVTAIVHDVLVGRGESDVRTLPAGLAVYNGFGKMVGCTQITELGTIETPVLLTSTLSVFGVADALLSYLHELPAFTGSATLNPVVAETNDSFLSDIWARPITARHVRAALDGAADGQVAEGCVGAGTGTTTLGFKGGIGTSSRLVGLSTQETVTVGAIVQSNFGRQLTVAGVPIPRPAEHPPENAREGNSCVIVMATDARLDSRGLTRLANRAFPAMARTGSDFSGRSGDYALAFSTATGQAAGSIDGHVPEKDLDLLFTAAIEATEEAILNSLFMATTTVGINGRIEHAVPLDYVQALVSGQVSTPNVVVTWSAPAGNLPTAARMLARSGKSAAKRMLRA
jgi:D-aminopeptidase